MKFVKQFLIIMAVTMAGELLRFLLPLPVPASIYGMVLLFILLQTGLLKLESIKDVAEYLLAIMPIMFISPGVGLIASWDVIKPVMLSIILCVFVAMFTVMASTGWTAELIMRAQRKRGKTE